MDIFGEINSLAHRITQSIQDADKNDSFSSDEFAENGIFVDCIQGNILDCNEYYLAFKDDYNSAQDSGYIETVSNSILLSLANHYGLEKITDENGNYTDEIKNIYKQIIQNNKRLYNYGLNEYSSISDINKVIAGISWDGKKNDLIDISYDGFETSGNKESESQLSETEEEDKKQFTENLIGFTNNVFDFFRPNNNTDNIVLNDDTTGVIEETEDFETLVDTAMMIDKDGKTYVYDEQGRLLSVRIIEQSQFPKEKAFVDLSNASANTKAIKGYTLDLNEYCCDKYKKFATNKKNKGKDNSYVNAVSNSLLKTFAEHYSIEKITDENGYYTDEIKNIYKQIVQNNPSLCSYGINENSSISEINAVLADISWDGKSNDIIDLSNISKNTSSPNDSFEFQYDENSRVISSTRINAEGIKETQTYSYNGDKVTITYPNGKQVEVDEKIFSEQMKFKMNYFSYQAKANSSFEYNGITYYYDENKNFLYSTIKSGNDTIISIYDKDENGKTIRINGNAFDVNGISPVYCETDNNKFKFDNEADLDAMEAALNDEELDAIGISEVSQFIGEEYYYETNGARFMVSIISPSADTLLNLSHKNPDSTYNNVDSIGNYNEISENSKLNKYQGYLRQKLESQFDNPDREKDYPNISAEDVEGFYFNANSQLSEDLALQPEVQSVVNGIQSGKIKRNSNGTYGSITLGNNGYQYSLHRADVIDFYIDENDGKMHLVLADTNDYNINDNLSNKKAKSLQAAGADAMLRGELISHYFIFDVIVN